MGGVTADRLAELLVGFGANVQPGQIVVVGSDFGKERLTRAVAERCYRAGAVFVDVQYGDRHLTRARVLYGSDDALGYEPEWTVARPRELVEKHGAMIVLSGPVETDVLSDLDPDRLGRDRPPGAAEWMRIAMERLANWTVGACPTPEWAALVHPDLEPEAAGPTVGAGGVRMPPGRRRPDRRVEPSRRRAGGGV